MSKNFQILRSFVFAFIVIVIGNYVIVAQNVLTGAWKADVKDEKAGKIHISFERQRGERGEKSQMGQSYDFGDLQGLTRRQISGGAVSFRLAREAGAIECEGRFENGKGAGTFRFTANAQFVSAMKNRGFNFEAAASRRNTNDSEDRLFAAATLNVTTALADDLLAADFGKLDVEDLIKAAIFKIDSKFMREMKSIGFANLGMEDLVKARIFNIDADFVRQVAAVGFDKEPFESLVKMRIFNITPEFLNEIKSEGLQNLDIEDYVKMKIFNIDAAFIRKAKSENPNATVEDMVQMRIGVYGR